jgi:hypothetical protein
MRGESDAGFGAELDHDEGWITRGLANAKHY